MCGQILNEVREKLKEEGYSGLFYPGECACVIDELAPCGECQREDGDDYINDCEPGYMFKDTRPDSPLGWVVKRENKEPSVDEWVEFDHSI